MVDLHYLFADALGYDPREQLQPASCTVYRVTCNTPEGTKDAVLKIPHLRDATLTAQFIREEARFLRAAEGLKTMPRLLAYHDLSDKDPAAFGYTRPKHLVGLVRTYTAGTEFQHARAQGRKINLEPLAKDVCRLHNRGLAGLDIRPSNIVVDDDGIARLLELGPREPMSAIRRRNRLDTLAATDISRLASLM